LKLKGLIESDLLLLVLYVQWGLMLFFFFFGFFILFNDWLKATGPVELVIS